MAIDFFGVLDPPVVVELDRRRRVGKMAPLRSLTAVLLSFTLTAICQVQGNIDEAERILNQAIQLAQSGRVEEAGPLFVKAATIAPDDPQVRASRTSAN